MDVGEEDRLFWLTDLGWLMGPMAITAALFHGATAVVFDGVPDHPGPDRLWSLVERHRISVMGLSPTAVRALMPHGHDPVHAHDLSSLRILGSTGEPWNPGAVPLALRARRAGRDPHHQLHRRHRDLRRNPRMLPHRAAQALRVHGTDPGHGRRVLRGGRPARARARRRAGDHQAVAGHDAGFWRDPARYEETYWSRWPNVWVHGDWAYVDDDGCWFIQGRSDDTLKIGRQAARAGRGRIGTGRPSRGRRGRGHRRSPRRQGGGRGLLRRAPPGPRAVRSAP